MTKYSNSNCVELFKSQLSDHCSVDYLGKGRVFWFQSLFRVCLPYSLHIFRHLGRVYHFSFLICYPCSSHSKTSKIAAAMSPHWAHYTMFILNIICPYYLKTDHSPHFAYGTLFGFWNSVTNKFDKLQLVVNRLLSCDFVKKTPKKTQKFEL